MTLDGINVLKIQSGSLPIVSYISVLHTVYTQKHFIFTPPIYIITTDIYINISHWCIRFSYEMKLHYEKTGEKCADKTNIQQQQ